MAGGNALLPYIYHGAQVASAGACADPAAERQNEGSMLCAQHALNNVLQGHFFDATQLGQIAAELAAYEADQLGLQPGMSDLGSRHMDDTGYFSVEVLDRAFRTWDMHLERWRPHERFKARYDHPENEFAFVLNLGSHWFVIRGFGTRNRAWCVLLTGRQNLTNQVQPKQLPVRAPVGRQRIPWNTAANSA